MAALFLACALSAAAQTATRQVLLLNSFERQPSTVHTQIFRTELSRRSPEPINFVEVSIQPAPFGPAPEDEPVVDYILSTIAGRKLDLVVSVGGPAAAFAQKHRVQLFPTTPLLEAALDARFLSASTFTAYETVVAGSLDLGRIVDNILVLLPQTTTVFAVMGTSAFEDYWHGESVREFHRFTDRPRIVWLNTLSFDDVLARAAAMPPRSAIFYLSMNVDGKGILQSDERALTQLHSVANAPLFSLYDFQLGHGIVGGPLISMNDLARHSVDVALRLLSGESPASIKTAVQEHGPPVYDWRELQRWGISEARLPAGSTVLFRQPGVWDQYKFYIVGAVSLVAVQSALIAGLFVQRVRRRRVELALRESEQRFRVMADQAPVLIWRSGVDKACDFFNQPWLDFRGRTLEQEQGSGWSEGVHADDLHDCIHTYGACFDAREPFNIEYRLQRADGEYRWVMDVGVPRYDEDGNFAGYIGSAVDISERRQVEQQNLELAGRLIHAQEEERSRIARDLHDDVSQQLAGLAIMLSGLKRKVGKPDSQAEVDQTVKTLQDRAATLATSIRTPVARPAPQRSAAHRPGRRPEAAVRRSGAASPPPGELQRPRRLRLGQSRSHALYLPGGAGGARQRLPARARQRHLGAPRRHQHGRGADRHRRWRRLRDRLARPERARAAQHRRACAPGGRRRQGGVAARRRHAGPGPGSDD